MPQTIGTFGLNSGGRIIGALASAPTPQPAPSTEGLVLPPAKKTNDTSGRIFVILIDDLHIQASESPRVRDVMKQFRDTVLHDNDLIAIKSTGPSNISVDPTYDFGHRRYDDAMNRVMGAGLSTMEIIQGATVESEDGPTALRYQAHVAQATAHELIVALAGIPDRRKSFILFSDGYDYNPFTQARYNQIQKAYADAGINDPNNPNDPTQTSATTNAALSSSSADFSNPTGVSPNDPMASPAYLKRTEFSNAELYQELAEVVRDARNAGVVFYPVDPRGLQTGMDPSLPMEIAYSDTRDHMQMQESSMRMIGEETGGYCVCQTNDFKRGFERIDNETSDYYIIGYNSSNADPKKIRREVKVVVTRPNVSLQYSTEYTIPRQNLNRK